MKKFNSRKSGLRLLVESVAKRMVNEVSGYDLEDLANDKSCGDTLYLVKLWWGTFWIEHYAAYANSAEEALNYVVAYLEKTSPRLLERTDLGAEELIDDLIEDGTAKTRDEAYNTPEFQESYTYVDATMEGADEPHYVYSENLAVEEYPEEFEHPTELGVQRRKPVKESSGDSVESVLKITDDLRVLHSNGSVIIKSRKNRNKMEDTQDGYGIAAELGSVNGFDYMDWIERNNVEVGRDFIRIPNENVGGIKRVHMRRWGD